MDSYQPQVHMAGYTKLATFMTDSHHPILKKYQHIAVRDLLYLQAELSELDHRFNLIAKEDSLQQDERQYYDRDWYHMNSSQERGFSGEQREIVIAMRGKLREYYAAMTEYSKIVSIRQPKPAERILLHNWTRKASLGGGCGFLGRDLGGFAQPSIYEEKHQNDLAILSDSHGEDDLFTRFVAGPLLRSYHRLRSSSKTPLPLNPELPVLDENRSNLHHYKDRHVEAVTNILGTILSSLAPLLSIVVLSFVTNEKARLGLVCAFTIFFSSCLAIATKARRVEIFAATAAFASVQVVFIGSSDQRQ